MLSNDFLANLKGLALPLRRCAFHKVDTAVNLGQWLSNWTTKQYRGRTASNKTEEYPTNGPKILANFTELHQTSLQLIEVRGMLIDLHLSGCQTMLMQLCQIQSARSTNPAVCLRWAVLAKFSRTSDC